jgi:hypothetical protein
MKSKLLFSAIFIAFLGIANISMAQDGNFAKTHPRRAEVNNRLNNQNRRIDHKVKDGQMSKRQANNLHRRDHQIRHEERSMASRHNGHLTKHEQSRINHQENHVSHRIHKA